MVTDETQQDEPSTLPTAQTDSSGKWEADAIARKGGILVALLVLLVSVFYVFAAVDDIIRAWLTYRWVPVWRAIFALAVAGLAVYVVTRLTR